MQKNKKRKEEQPDKKPVKRRKSNKATLWELLNPANLRKQIDSYGYEFSIGKYIVLMCVVSAGVLALGMLFSLHLEMTALIIIFFLLQLPGIILDAYRNMYEHKKFLDLADYMEQILYSFKSEQKILAALRDTATMFRGKMREKILEAAAYIEAGKAEENLYKEALDIIENAYPNRRLSAIHRYLRSVEKNGGDNMESVDLLIRDKNIWADNVLILQKDRKHKRNLIFGSLLITTIFAAAFHYIYRMMPEYNMADNTIVQIATTLYLILNIMIFRKANREIAKSWAENDNTDDTRVVAYYNKIMNYDEKKEQLTSLCMGIPVLVIAVVLFVFRHKIWGAAAASVGILLLNQHKVGYRTAYNRVVKEINTAFSQWLMQMALLLQTNNVRRSIAMSVEDAPVVLKPALQKMKEDLEKEPDSDEPFQTFLGMFELSSVQSAMKMLYSISTLGSGDAKEQIKALIERNIGLLDKAEKIKNEEKLAGIEGVFFLPQVTLSAQLIVGLFIFMMLFLQNVAA